MAEKFGWNTNIESFLFLLCITNILSQKQLGCLESMSIKITQKVFKVRWCKLAFIKDLVFSMLRCHFKLLYER